MVFRQRALSLADFTPDDGEEGMLRLYFTDRNTIFVTSNRCSPGHFPLAPDYLPSEIRQFVEDHRRTARDYAFLREGTVGSRLVFYVGTKYQSAGYCLSGDKLESIRPCEYNEGYHDNFTIRAQHGVTSPSC